MILCRFTEIVEKPRFSPHFHLPRRRVVADRAADLGGTSRNQMERMCEISIFFEFLYIHKLMILCQFTEIVKKTTFFATFLAAPAQGGGGSGCRPRRHI